MSEKEDSFIQLAQKPEGITLTLRAPKDGEEDITYQELVECLEGLSFPTLNYGAIEQSYKQDRDRPLVICPGDSEAFKVVVSSDEMAAHLILYDWDGDSPQALKSRIFEVLKEKGVRYGLNREAVERVLAEGVGFTKVCVAEGRPPTKGSNASVHHPLVPPELEVPEGRGVDSMRLWSEPLIIVVEPNTVIAEKRWEGAEGQKGMTVTGRPIAAPGGDDLVLHGGDAEVSADGNVLTATVRGQLLVHARGADVGPLKEIEGDLEGDGESVKFDGSVIVRGSVREDVVIRAAGDVEVWGPVSSATIIAGRNVVLRSEVKGLNETSIRAGGRIAVVSVEEADVAAKDSLFVLESLIECRAGARRRVVMGPEGRLAGGTVIAGELLQVAHLGRPKGARTQVKVATPDLLQKWQELLREELAKKMEPLEDSRAKLRSSIGALQRRKERRGGRLEPSNEQLLHQMEQDLDGVTGRCQEIEERLRKLPGREHFVRAGKICGLRKLYPSVEINLGTVNFGPKDEEEAQRLIEGPEGITAEWIESCLAAF